MFLVYERKNARASDRMSVLVVTRLGGQGCTEGWHWLHTRERENQYRVRYVRTCTEAEYNISLLKRIRQKLSNYWYYDSYTLGYCYRRIISHVIKQVINLRTLAVIKT